MNTLIEETIKLAKVRGAFGINGQMLVLPFTPNAKWIYDLSEITLVKSVSNIKTSMNNQDLPPSSHF